MNSLSWLLYAADVSSGVDATLSAIAGLSAVGSIASGIACCIFRFSSPGFWSWQDSDERERIRKQWGAGASFSAKSLKVSCAILIASMAVSAVIPARGTIYAIAASEMGEKVLMTQTGDKAVKALDAWLDRQIAGDRPSGKK